MRIAIFTVLILTAVAALFIAYGCAKQERSFGQPLTEAGFTAIADILVKPEQFADKTVKVQGAITNECPSGGWFFLKDESGVIYVNLHPSYFAIPQAVGRQATAQGRVRKEGPQVEIIAEGVELK
ncbi:MAG: hypothetical protein PHF11_05680 [Candidatus Omnitrophica bacterium]|nr:hypothetical protein [Candidatus Omnitrophota bacterium]